MDLISDTVVLRINRKTGVSPRLMEVIEPPAKGRAAGSIEILGDADPGQAGMVTYMLL